MHQSAVGLGLCDDFCDPEGLTSFVTKWIDQDMLDKPKARPGLYMA